MVETAVSEGVTLHSLYFIWANDAIDKPAIIFQDWTFLAQKAYDSYFTSCVPPAGHPAVVPWFKVDLLARQAGIADEVSGRDVRASFNQCNVIV